MMVQEVHMDVRVVSTRQFGDLQVEPRHIFEFPEGIFGFDDLREFVLIADEQSAPLNWLISIEQPEIGFPVLDPKHIDSSYSPGRDYVNDDRYAVYAIVTLSHSGMTVNLKAPVILDCTNLTGKQIILSSERYQPNQPLGKQSRA